MEDSILTQPTASASLIKHRTIALNSSIYFVLAYLIVHLCYQLATIFAASSANIPTGLFAGHIQFRISDNQWVKPDVISTYSAGPAFCFFLAIIFLIAFNRAVRLRGNAKVFFLWAFTHALNLVLGSLLAGCVVQGGFWYAVQWSVINYEMVWAIAGVSGLLLLAAGVFLAPTFLISCNSLTLLQLENRRSLLLNTLVFPWLGGSLFIFLLKVPDFNLYEGLQLLTLLLFLAPAYFRNLNSQAVEPLAAPRKPRLATGGMMLLGFLALLFRIWLQNGISFS